MGAEKEIAFHDQEVGFKPLQNMGKSLSLQQKHAKLMSRGQAVNTVKSKSSLEKVLLRKDSTQEDLNNREEDSKTQEDYTGNTGRISEEFVEDYDHLANDEFQMESENRYLQDQMVRPSEPAESEDAPFEENQMTKENCLESGSSGGTQCIEVQGKKRKKQNPQRSITVDEIQIINPAIPNESQN